MEIRRLLENWNKFASTPEQLNEAIEDLGLPQLVVDEIDAKLFDAKPKAKTWFATLVKKHINESLSIESSRNQQAEFMQEVIRELRSVEFPTENEDKTQTFSNIIDDLVVVRNKVQYKNNFDYDERRKTVKSITSIYTKFLPKLGIKLPEGFNPEEKAAMAQKKLIVDPMKDVINLLDTVAIAIKIDEDATIKVINLQTQSIENVLEEATTVLNARDYEDQLVHKFDNGFFWYNLNTKYCRIEAARMHNCGRDPNGTLYSLRWKGPKDKQSKSFVLISYNEETSTIYQIKGFEMNGEVIYGNRAPPKIIKGPKGQEAHLWDMIVWFIKQFDVQYVVDKASWVKGAENIAKFRQMSQYLDENTEAQVEYPDDTGEKLAQECADTQERWRRRLSYLTTEYDIVQDDELPYVLYGASGILPITISSEGAEDIDIRNRAFINTVYEAIDDFIKENIGRPHTHIQLHRYDDRIERADSVLRVYVSAYSEDLGPDVEGYEEFCSYVRDIEDSLDEITSRVGYNLESEGWIQTTSADYEEFVNYSLQELEDDLEHIKVRWDEDSPSEGVTFSLLKDPSGMYGVPYNFGNYKFVFGPYQNDTSDNIYETTYQKSMQQFHDTAVKLLKKELETVQRQAVSQLEIPVGKEPAKSYSAAKIENVNVSLNRSFDDELKLSLSVNIGAFSNDDEITSAVALARYLDENADQIVALLKKEFDSILKFNFDKIGLDTDQLDLVESIARAIIRRMKW